MRPGFISATVAPCLSSSTGYRAALLCLHEAEKLGKKMGAMKGQRADVTTERHADFYEKAEETKLAFCDTNEEKRLALVSQSGTLERAQKWVTSSCSCKSTFRVLKRLLGVTRLSRLALLRRLASFGARFRSPTHTLTCTPDSVSLAVIQIPVLLTVLISSAVKRNWYLASFA